MNRGVPHPTIIPLEGEPNTTYEFRSAADLVFNPGTLIENLVPGSTPAGTIGGPNNSLLTTDGNGKGTAQVTLTGPTRDFVRAQTPPAGP